MSGMLLRIHGIHNYSFVNGPGKRCVIHLQGCNLACRGCFNPQTHSMDGGVLLSPEQLVTGVPEDVDGVTISGGEPFLQSEGLLGLVRCLRRRKLSIILYTGYTLQELENIPHSLDILEQIDVLIDGRYDQDLPRTNGTAGSVNQTIHLLTDKYVPADFENRQAEITVNRDGTMQITGFPLADLLREMTTTLNTLSNRR
jgi:anaerobic ribonucleoside-triphosphate reductase activating protein